MTSIETIRIEGWGGATEIRGLAVEADYQPGIFEAAELAASAWSVVTAAAGVALGLAMTALGFQSLGWLCYGAALVSLGAAAFMWCRALEGLRARGTRSIHLARGSVEFGNEIRWLRDATIDIECAEIARFPKLSRLSLVFPDGAQILLAQGPHHRICDLVHALRHAPCVSSSARLAA